jgi:poly-gamma-glutamate synthesis protein (capsule biosynthesis protein)
MRSPPRVVDGASRLTFLGDVFPKDVFAFEVALPGAIVLNLEAPLTDHTVGYPGKINLRGRAEHLAAAFAPLPVAVGLANNHIMDFYEPGLTDTVRELERLGIASFGAGSPGDAFRNPAMLTVGDLTVALLGYADESSTPVYHTDEHPGAARLDLAAVVHDISAARDRGADRVVVMAHWGQEQVTLPSLRCVELGRAMIDAGADLIIGHHAHCIQSFEVFRGKHIFYGLGNCVFPAHQSPSYFGPDGVSTRNADSRPSAHNRKSLAVTWDPGTGAVATTPLFFDDRTVHRGRFSADRYRLELASLDGYEERYQRAFNRGTLHHTIMRFLSKPKLPRLSHYKALRRLFRSAPPR